MKRMIIAAMLFIAAIFGVSSLVVAPAEASAPVAQRWPADLYHSNVGNDQAFAIECTTGHGPFWVQKLQTAYQKCLYGSRQAYSIYVPANFTVICNSSAGGFQFWGGQWYSIPGGTYGCYTNHL